MIEGPWLLDTTVLIDVLRGRRSAVDWVNTLPADDRVISVMTTVELLAGCRDLREQRSLDTERRLFHTVWLDENLCRHALEMYRAHRLRDGIGFVDCFIAATATHSGRRLATSNVRRFRQLAGVDAVTPNGSSASPTV